MQVTNCFSKTGVTAKIIMWSCNLKTQTAELFSSTDAPNEQTIMKLLAFIGHTTHSLSMLGSILSCRTGRASISVPLDSVIGELLGLFEYCDCLSLINTPELVPPLRTMLSHVVNIIGTLSRTQMETEHVFKTEKISILFENLFVKGASHSGSANFKDLIVELVCNVASSPYGLAGQSLETVLISALPQEITRSVQNTRQFLKALVNLRKTSAYCCYQSLPQLVSATRGLAATVPSVKRLLAELALGILSHPCDMVPFAKVCIEVLFSCLDVFPVEYLDTITLSLGSVNFEFLLMVQNFVTTVLSTAIKKRFSREVSLSESLLHGFLLDEYDSEFPTDSHYHFHALRFVQSLAVCPTFPLLLEDQNATSAVSLVIRAAALLQTVDSSVPISPSCRIVQNLFVLFLQL